MRKPSALPRLFRSVGAAITTIAVATLVAVAGSGATYALWNSSAAVPPAVLRSGSAAMTVSQPSAFTGLAPGLSVNRTVSVRNTGTTAIVPQITAASFSGPLAEWATVQLRSTGSCPATGAVSATVLWQRNPTSTSVVPTSLGVSLAANGTRTVCISITLAGDTPASLRGATLSPNIELTGRQP